MQPDLETGELFRYRRQTAFALIGEEGQRCLAASSVLIVGCGALGSSAASLLVRAGVGRIVLVDPDTVQYDNLHRQPLFDETDAMAMRPKVDAARDTLRRANSTVNIETHCERFHPENADDFLRGIALLLDGTDNFRTRLAMNAAAVRHRIPMITAGVLGATGQVATILPGETPCLACLIDPDDANRLDRPSGMEETGILAPVVQVIAALEAMEAIKILTGNRDAVRKDLLHVDLWKNRCHAIPFERNFSSHCPVCGRMH